ncbi:Co/Zn/Cd efflux system component [Catenulispora sp. GAS73]|uniref:hypothetical protein n=1 Tax=Catenulispora sp. GAS73 TaxID=3156269 RepID=UPI003513FDFA
MVVIFVAVAGCVVVALLGRAVSTAAQRTRGWYRGSVAGSAIELVALAALVGGLLGELYTRMRP